MSNDHWTAEEYRRFRETGQMPVRGGSGGLKARRSAGGQSADPDGGKVIPLSRADPEAPKRRKYGNEPCYLQGKRFDSKHEALVYKDLLTRVKAGELRCVLRQVRFDLADFERLEYVADFVTIAPDMTIEVLDAKSEATRKDKVYVIKKKLMREKWGIEIREV